MQPAASQQTGWRERFTALKNLPQVMRLVWHAAPGVVTGGLLFRIAVALIPLAILAVSKRIIDIVVSAVKGSGTSSPSDVWMWLAIQFVLAAGGLALGRAIDYFDARLADEFTRDVSLRVMQHAATLDLACFEDANFYDKLERARVQATDRIGMLTALGSLVQRGVTLISLAAGLVYYSPWLFGLLLLCVVPVFAGESHFAFLGYSLAHRLTPVRRELDYLRVLGSSRESAKEIKMFGIAEYLRDRYQALSEQVIRSNRQLTQRRLRWGTLLAVGGSLGYYGGYSYLVWQAAQGNITVGTLTFLAGAVAGANTELQSLFSLFSSIAEQALFLTDLLAFLAVQPRIQSKPDSIPAPRPIREGIEFRNVSFHYPGSNHLVLKDLHFRIESGERVALVGENGQGKTTFVKLIARLYEPTEGSILLDGIDLREYRVEDLRREIGIIFQDFFRYDMAVRDNIGTGRVEFIRHDAALWEAARKSRADEMVARLPGRLEQMLGRRFEGGVDLSGGEWQRMALARAYLRDAQVLILDEPTASLDAVAEAEVFKNFAELMGGRMAILISHRFSTVRMADRIVVLSNGQIEEEGSHDRLIAVGGQYARLFEMQAAKYR
ncbi:MAG: ABC transporter ATP-binding protein [Acidobacteria bacterium]|jgi:ATP-binding cassette subfamily B protein|nr:MAG: ABC transporter ATP-binding protein [Acidobacteriota bacterium]